MTKQRDDGGPKVDPITGNVYWTVEALHREWLEKRKADPTLKHPLAPLIKAWQERNSAK